MCAPSAGPHGKFAVINKKRRIGAKKTTTTTTAAARKTRDMSLHVQFTSHLRCSDKRAAIKIKEKSNRILPTLATKPESEPQRQGIMLAWLTTSFRGTLIRHKFARLKPNLCSVSGPRRVSLSLYLPLWRQNTECATSTSSVVRCPLSTVRSRWLCRLHLHSQLNNFH